MCSASIYRRLLGGGLLCAVAAVNAQVDPTQGLAASDPARRARAARSLGDAADGFRHLDSLAPLLKDASEEVRVAAVAALVKIRTVDAQPLLIEATEDASASVQSLAVDGLVEFYSPEYVRSGRLGSVRNYAGTLKGRLAKPNPATVPPYIDVNPQATAAIARLVTAGASIESRANAARALGVLFAGNALDALEEGVRSRNTTIILESVLAIKKIKDPVAGPSLVFLLRDLDPGVQLAVIQTVGQLRTGEAVPELVWVVENDAKTRTRQAALTALAKIADNGQRSLFLRYLADKESGMRAAAAEGLGRLGNPDDLRVLDHHYSLEKSTSAKLSLAFATVQLGNLVRLGFLVEQLNSRLHRLEARPFLVELSRDPTVLERLYLPLSTGTPAQRRHLAAVVAESGTADSLPHLQNLSQDANSEVASAALDAMRVLRARL